MSRIRWVAALTAALVAVLAIAVPAGAAGTASAKKPKTRTLHFFSKRVYSRISDASGKKLGRNFVPVIGDRVTYASDDYTGNHTKHANKATASDESACIIITGNSVLCDGTFAIGGALIIADDYTLGFPPKKSTIAIKITGGTGRFKGARGTVSATTVGNNLDVTIKVTV